MKYMRGVYKFCIPVLLVIVYSSPVMADVTVESYTKFGGFGGMGATESQEKVSIKGLKKNVESKGKFTGKLLGMMGGEKKNSTVYRVDRDLIWNINHKKKSYTEQPIMAPKIDESRQAQSGGPAGQGDEKAEKPETRIIKNEFNIKGTGAKKTVNGYPCKQYIVTWLLVTENVKTGAQKKSLMTTDIWNTPEDAKIKKLMEEESAFNSAYLKKLGLEMNPGDMKKMGLNMIGGLAGASGKDLKKEFAKIKGYPIATSVKWESSGDKDQEENDSGGGGMDLSKGLGGLLGGLSKKAVKDRSKKSEGEMRVVFDSYTEIKSISTSDLPKSLFEVPEGYKKGKSWRDKLKEKK
jgi:hypothetical protein